MHFPIMTRIRRHFPSAKLASVEKTMQQELFLSGINLPKGATIALAVGSRGIRNLQGIVRETVDWVKEQGATPFIVPAMGSHGGATGAGQQAVLESYGISEALVGASIRASMETVELPQGLLPWKIFFDRHASQAAGTILINRVKPHTDFHGHYESGLMKMTVIGLGKQHQAQQMHGLGVPGLRDVIPQVAVQSFRSNNVLFGIAVVENSYDETCAIKVIPKARIAEEEPPLLEMARTLMPDLPLEAIDILIVDEIGKDISGAGLDTNVIGRLKIAGQPEPASPSIKMIILRDISERSHGNAVGTGLADIITRRLFDKIDYRSTYQNLVTSGFLERGKVPVIAETDLQAVHFALAGSAPLKMEEARILRIRNTLRLDELWVSPRVLEELQGRQDIEIIGPIEAPLDAGGTLRDF
jgi:hypothetical protein